MIEVPLTRGLVALIDDEDTHVLNHKWYAQRARSGFYAARTVNYECVLLHRELLDAKPYEQVDHKDHNTLNCTRANIRICTPTQNRQNSRPYNGRRFKGVKKNASGSTYMARIKVAGKEVYLGCFPTQEDAAHAYDEAAKEYFGDYAKLNFN